jgi:hypothetical protein
MRDVVALTGAAVGFSHLVLRAYVHISAVSLCREARRLGWDVRVRVGWSPSLEVEMTPPSGDMPPAPGSTNRDSDLDS